MLKRIPMGLRLSAGIAVLWLMVLAIPHSRLASEHPQQTPNVRSNGKSVLPRRAEAAQEENNPSVANAPEVNAIARKSESANAGDETSEFWSVFGQRLKITDSLLVLLTLLLATATFLLWWATRNLVVGAADTAESQLRAYVFGKPTNVDIHGGNLHSVTLTIRNHGATPASKIGMRGSVQIHPWPLPNEVQIEFPEVEETSQNLAPATEYPAIVAVGLPIAEEAAQKLRSGTHKLYALVAITYKDAFGKTRRTNMCSAMDGRTFMAALERSKGGEAGAIRHDTAWSFCHRYNDWT